MSKSYKTKIRVREGTFSLAGGGLGPQRRGSSVKVSTKRGGPYLFVSYLRGGSHIFSRIFFNKDFCLLLSIFLQQIKFFLFNFFD